MFWEKGSYVRECNLAVRFDGLNTVREFLQSKGRTRAKNAYFYIMSNSSCVTCFYSKT